MMPEQSAAKAKQLLQQAIEALGGPAYLNVRDVTCTGHVGQFDNHEILSGYVEVDDSRRPPDKAMIEYIGKGGNTIWQYMAGIDDLEYAKGGIVITLFDGDHGWSYDRSGVNELPAGAVSDFQEQVKRNLGNLLRFRLKEPGMFFRYAGRDAVDLKQVDWVELEDADERTIRIALASDTHLPIRKVVETRDPNTRTKASETEYYSNYHTVDGVQTPFQLLRARNGVKVFQEFFDKCEYNTGLSDSLFTRASLEERWAKSGNKEKDKSKNKKKDNASSSSDQ
jgi:hypothetical protein